LENVKPTNFPAVPERAKKDHNFTGKIGETWKTDCGEHTDSKGEPGERHHPRKSAELIKSQRARPPAQFACDAK
jgi:hypothetical protein